MSAAPHGPIVLNLAKPTVESLATLFERLTERSCPTAAGRSYARRWSRSRSRSDWLELRRTTRDG